MKAYGRGHRKTGLGFAAGVGERIWGLLSYLREYLPYTGSLRGIFANRSIGNSETAELMLTSGFAIFYYYCLYDFMF